jgi:hypothetical protein
MIQAGIAREPDHDLAANLAQDHGCRSVIAFLPNIADFQFDELVFHPIEMQAKRSHSAAMRGLLRPRPAGVWLGLAELMSPLAADS